MIADSRRSSLTWRAAIGVAFVISVTSGCGDKSYRCPTSAMMPTLGAKDIFKAELNPYEAESPQRYDIVVFKLPPAVSRKQDEKGVKRIVGLPGEQISFQGFRVVINGELISEPQILVPEDVQKYEGSAAPPNTDPITVPEGHVFVAGDNRNNSLDSRYFGPIPVSAIEARALVITRANDGQRVGRRLDQNRVGAN